jgi:hypothetical protein
MRRNAIHQLAEVNEEIERTATSEREKLISLLEKKAELERELNLVEEIFYGR